MRVNVVGNTIGDGKVDAAKVIVSIFFRIVTKLQHLFKFSVT